jgi:acetylornithine deacetylase/succinyl-diaminopimelate desuccinylase-like protein
MAAESQSAAPAVARSVGAHRTYHGGTVAWHSCRSNHVNWATDGLYLRKAGIPTYGVSGLFDDIDDIRAHGRDERLGVKEFFEGQEFLYRLVKALASGAS